jgi:hypothetical protein
VKESDAIPKKVAVLMGGPGSERDVSLATGRGVAKALRSLGAQVVEVDVRDEHFELPAEIDLAFLTIHGTFGEDGQVQRILEQRGVAYTGDGVEASATAFDKIRSKEKFREHGVTTPHWQVVKAGQRATIPLPIVVKPPRQGSTVGIVIVKNEGELESAMAEAAKYDRELLIEEFVPGKELTIILGHHALPILEMFEGRLLRFHEQVSLLESSGWGRSRTCLSGEDSRGSNPRHSRARFARASLAWLAGLFARRCSFARKWRGHCLGSEHDSGDDRSEFAARSRCCRRH